MWRVLSPDFDRGKKVYNQCLVSPPLALITATILSGILKTSLLHISGVIFVQVANARPASSTRELGTSGGFPSSPFRWFQRCSIGFKFWMIVMAII